MPSDKEQLVFDMICLNQKKYLSLIIVVLKERKNYNKSRKRLYAWILCGWGGTELSFLN